MPTLPVAEWRPDMPDLVDSGSGTITNVLPRTSKSYGPLPSLNPQSASALDARCQGGFTCQDRDGNVHLFAGTATKLWHLTAGSSGWTDVSKVGGYSTNSNERWCFVLFGNRVIATNWNDPPQSFDLTSSTLFANLITSGMTSLRARYVAVVRDWVVFANTFDGTDGARPARVWWSAIDDPTNFPTPGTSGAAAVQSDFQDLYEGTGDGFGWIQGIVGGLGTADGAVFQERGIKRMVYAGAPAIFAFSTAEGVRGCPAPGSIVQRGNIVDYLGEDGFYSFDGSSSAPIGYEKVDKTFFGDLDQSMFYRISAAVDPINKLVFWAYPGAGHSGNCNRLLARNWATGWWTTSAAGDIVCEILLRSLSLGYSLEQLDTPIPSIDSGSPDSLDSRVWTGGRILLSAFDASHRLNYFTGANLAPTVDTSETAPADGRIVLVRNARPIVDAGTPSLAVGVRNRQIDSVTWGSAVALDDNGNCPQRASGRYVRGRITLPAGSSFTHISGLEIGPGDVVPQGVR
jgi:hypothetical protein